DDDLEDESRTPFPNITVTGRSISASRGTAPPGNPNVGTSTRMMSPFLPPDVVVDKRVMNLPYNTNVNAGNSQEHALTATGATLSSTSCTTQKDVGDESPPTPTSSEREGTNRRRVPLSSSSQSL
ncbi:unnamed protein product, partial [Amoebophrya sp. A25]